MSCVEKRHINHRMGSMLHHRFPNGFTDLFMDETDREVSTLTDRAFRSLCVGDDAVYNDELLCGYSPYSCLKPLAGEPFKKNLHKESKKAGQHKQDKDYAQPRKQEQQQDDMSHMSSFLKVLSVAEERNGGMTDSNGESWHKSALRSIERELSEFSSDYHTSLTNRHYENNKSGCGSANKKCKDDNLPSGNLTKTKNAKSTAKLRQLNIKNFFLHSEFSPFQTWTDLNRYPFGQDNTVTDILCADNVPKWYDLPFYKELTEAHTSEILHAGEVQSCQKVRVEPSTANVPELSPAPPPPKVLPKPAAPLAQKRCSSDGGDKTAAPWRRNGPRAKSVIPANQLRKPPQEINSKPMDENILVVKKDTESVEVTAIQEVSSSASTPFSICQLMTPVIPSRQPTETSEILQAVLSPSVLDLLTRPHSEAKVTSEPPVKRETYKSLASSILFNLKDNRKRVKSRYSPHKFKTLELSDGGVQSPPSDNANQPPSEGSGSGLSTPAKDGQTVSGPVVQHIVSPANVEFTGHCNDKPSSDDYLLANLLQTKCDADNRNLGEENSISSYISSKKNKSPMAKNQNYPSLNLYKKANPVDSDLKYLQVPPSNNTLSNADSMINAKNRELSPNALPTNTGLSPSTLNVIKDYSPIISPHILERGGLPSGEKTQPNVPEKTEWPVKGTKDFGVQLASEEDNTGGQTISTTNVIRAAKEAINAAKNKARSASHSDSNSKQIPDADVMRQKERDQRVSKEPFESRRDSLVTENNYGLLLNEPSDTTLVSTNSNISKEPPPVPKRTFSKSDLQLCLSPDKQRRRHTDKASKSDLVDAKPDLLHKEHEPVRKQGQPKHAFSSRQNNFIKNQRFTLTDDEQAKQCKESNLNVNAKVEADVEVKSGGDTRESEHIFNDLQALKELEKARLGDRVLENVKNKQEVLNIDEEAKVKNNLISRELRNIKRGMLSMRGNTSAKRKIFTEKEQSKQEVFTKVDSNVIVNKALLNDNYDKAKMALEEIISERERRNKFTEQEAVVASENNILDEGCEIWLQNSKAHKDCMTRPREEKKNSTSPRQEKKQKQRLGDLRVMSQPRPAETFGLGSREALLDKAGSEQNLCLKVKDKDVGERLVDNHAHNRDASLPETAGQTHKESKDYLMNERKDKGLNAPPVPPRSKKGVSRGDGSATSDKDLVDGCGKNDNFERREEESCDIRTGPKIYVSTETEEALPSQRETSLKEREDEVKNSTAVAYGLVNNSVINASPKREVTPGSHANTQESCKVKRKAPFKPDSSIKQDDDLIKNFKPDEPFKITSEDITIDAEELGEIPRNIVSPLLLIKSVSVAQSPPDQASLSSKSSYFSVESTLHRTTETESNVFHSLENSPAEVEEVIQLGRPVSRSNSNGGGVGYCCLSDHESELEGMNKCLSSTPNQPDLQHMDSMDKNIVISDERLVNEESNSTTSSSSTFSPILGIPALFKVKNNSFNSKTKKPVIPWSPRGSNNVEKIEKELNKTRENPELSLANDSSTNNVIITPPEVFKPMEFSGSKSPQFLTVSSNVQNESPKTSQVGNSLLVPQEEERFFRVTPSSEDIESLPTSTADPTDDAVTNANLLEESEMTKDISEQSGFIVSGNDNQIGLPKPPAVLPKSEKAVQKAIKLTNRRMKKEESQKSSQKSSQSSGKHRAEKVRSDKSEHKSSGNTKTGRSGEKKHKDGSRHNSNNHSNDCNPQRESHNENHNQNKVETNRTRRQSRDSVEGNRQRNDERPKPASERQGRSTDRHPREKPEHRDYSSDSVISNVPVYKAHISERPVSDRPFNRSQSTDRYLRGKVERRLSADIPASEKLEPRTQRIEKSIINELQQRGRAADKQSRGAPLRRSQSIDAYSTEIPPLSRQSSQTSQFSHQSSLEHAILTQSIPMTQRKLLQDPNSGQYFFVDLPVQVKTKTFFDPDTGSYVQLPVQPPDGGVPQAPHVEVLTSPLVVYHSFVPVPLSPMAPKAKIQAALVEPNGLEQRHQERGRKMHIKEGQPYLESAYGQQDLMLGEFLGTEELDCPC
ncbi:uncharacterized protein LOC129377539 [Poeciliopsis prolifica]|uniref:uncharacterized protein LOC129377539 n=1 Tax=Poeciliopsis prolifica TaxID=188132 RepID=UPI002414130E|nr:uncharacterized protein LOC129377539 [Poeciliopsis prolifica]